MRFLRDHTEERFLELTACCLRIDGVLVTAWVAGIALHIAVLPPVDQPYYSYTMRTLSTSKLISFHSHENVLNAASILSLEKTVVIYSEREHEILLALGNLGQPVNA